MQLRDTQLVGKPFKYLEGRAVPYNVWADVGWFLEQHDKGSLDRTTKEAAKGLPLLLFHNNRTWPVGVSESWDHQDDGLHGVWRLNQTNDAQQAAWLAESGELGYLSIGFSPIRSAWEYVDDFNPDLGPNHMDRVTRLESRLLEVSLTPTPAFSTAEITMVRSAERPRPRTESKVDIWRRELDKLRSSRAVETPA
jgi:HK97 family phage prohead protease